MTGEGAFDFSSLRGKTVSAVAAVAQHAARPCLVLAGRVDVGHREAATVGVEAAYDLVSEAGSEHAAMAEPAPGWHRRQPAQRARGVGSR